VARILRSTATAPAGDIRKEIKMAAKNQEGVMWTIFSTEIQLKRHIAAL
jgi:hypothetical protein